MKRVVITGMGAVSPVGNTVSDMWQSLRSGTSGVGPITRFDASEHVTSYAAEVKDFDPRSRLDRREVRKMDRFTQYAAYAAMEAWESAGFSIEDPAVDRDRVGVVLGVGIGGFETIEESLQALIEKGPSRVPPMTVPKMIANIAPAHIAILLQLYGPVYSMATACASSSDSVGNAMRHIREGIVDVVVTGGVEAAITPFGVSGFNVIQALSSGYADNPTKASRPFDKDRDGFVLGEGAGILILESLEHAQARGATIYAELAGHGFTNDANHLTAPHPEAAGAIKGMKAALRDAGVEPGEISYINAHGTSTPLNDPLETKAIKAVFGEDAYRIPVSSTKSMTGHCVGAAGGIEAIISTLALYNQYIPPTINLENPDEQCDLDYVPHVGRDAELSVVMSNSLGFGGHNGILVLKRFEDGR